MIHLKRNNFFNAILKQSVENKSSELENNLNGRNLELYNKLIFKYFRRVITKAVNFEISLSEVPGVAI